MGHRQMVGVVLAVLTAAAVTSPARAQTPGEPEAAEALTRARTHFEAGRALYELGNYREALHEFAAGHAVAPRPQFLLNLGQCYRKLGELGEAQKMYRRYLSEAPPGEPERAQARQILTEIDAQLADRETAAARQAAVAHEAALAASAEALHRAGAARPSFAKRHWWVFPVGAVVVGAGVGLGIYFGTRGDPACGGATLGCWDLTKVP